MAQIIGGIPEYPADSGPASGLNRDSIVDASPPENRNAPRTLPYGQGKSVPFATFQARNPEYLAETWERCRAFYKGGAALLENDQLMLKVFPKHLAERSHVYQERCRRAFYLNYPGSIVDWFVSSLPSDPLRVGVEPEDEEAETEEEVELPDEFWEEFVKDVSGPGGETCTVQQFMLEQLRTAFQTRRVWCLVDLPIVDAPVPPGNLAQQEKLGQLDAYLVHVEPEEVIDWEADGNGEIMWAIRCVTSRPRADWKSTRDTIVQRYTVYTRDAWEAYEIRYKVNERPDPKDPVFWVGGGPLTFGRVPLVPFVLPDGLWAMGKLESPARAHFNKRNALDWAEHKSLLPLLYEFLGPEDGAGSTDAANANDPNRAVMQPRGSGYVQVRGEKDRAEYVGPDPGPFAAALESSRDLRDEMHRVTHQMALATNNTGAALARSAESKGEDKGDRTIVLEEVGRLLRDHVVRVITAVSEARGDAESEWKARGWESFDLDSLGDMIDQAVNLEVVTIPSPTFKRLHLLDLCAKRLGEKATPDVLAQIEKELEQGLSMETMATKAAHQQVIDGPDEDGDDPEGTPVTPPKSSGKLSYSSGAT